MTIFRRMILTMVLVGTLVGVSTVASAREHTEADIKMLRDAAAALKLPHPDLASGLSQYADKEAQELDQAMKESSEKEEAGEKVEPKDEQGENAKY